MQMYCLCGVDIDRKTVQFIALDTGIGSSSTSWQSRSIVCLRMLACHLERFRRGVVLD
jgi:hypothetical protein